MLPGSFHARRIGQLDTLYHPGRVNAHKRRCRDRTALAEWFVWLATSSISKPLRAADVERRPQQPSDDLSLWSSLLNAAVWARLPVSGLRAGAVQSSVSVWVLPLSFVPVFMLWPVQSSPVRVRLRPIPLALPR
jgi:hypothetical protein